MKFFWCVVAVALVLSVIGGDMAAAQNCGRQAGGRSCAGGICCSQWGWCGTTSAHCGSGCQSGCRSAAASVDPDAAEASVDPDATAAGNP